MLCSLWPFEKLLQKNQKTSRNFNSLCGHLSCFETVPEVQVFFNERVRKYLLVLSLELVLLVPSCSFQVQDKGTKTTDSYWAQTGLTDKELQTLLGDHNCYLNQSQFLACVNAVNVVAERQGLALLLDGSLSPRRGLELRHLQTEKIFLKKWESVYTNKNQKIFFLRIWDQLKKSISPNQQPARVAEALNAYLSILKDPHSYLIPLAQYEEMVANHEAKESGSGMVVRPTANGLVVRKVLKGSPAQVAGLKRGDLIIELNGMGVQKLSRSEINDLVKFRHHPRLGALVRNTQNKVQYVDLFKKEGVYPSVESKIVNQSIGLGIISIHKFARSTCDHVRREIVGLREQNLKGLILDLRDNPGGLVSEAACVISQFVSPGRLLFETKYLDKHRKSDQYFSDQEPSYMGPLAILINSGSASASEIVAGSLRDLGRALLVGERSFGKGSFQDGHIWGGNEKVALFQTEGLYFFPSGWTAQLTGIEPDIEVQFNIAANSREEDLYYNPVAPRKGPGPKISRLASWLPQCEDNGDEDLPWYQGQGLTDMDPQIEKAQQLVSCGEANGRHGSL